MKHSTLAGHLRTAIAIADILERCRAEESFFDLLLDDMRVLPVGYKACLDIWVSFDKFLNFLHTIRSSIDALADGEIQRLSLSGMLGKLNSTRSLLLARHKATGALHGMQGCKSRIKRVSLKSCLLPI